MYLFKGAEGEILIWIGWFYRTAQYLVFERRLTDSLRLSCPLPVIGQLELM